MAAETLIEDIQSLVPESRTQRVKWRKQIFASPGIVDPDDEVGKLLQQLQNEIEKLCAPIVRRPFK